MPGLHSKKMSIKGRRIRLQSVCLVWDLQETLEHATRTSGIHNKRSFQKNLVPFMIHFNFPGRCHKWIIIHTYRFSRLKQDCTLIHRSLTQEGVNILTKPVSVAFGVLITGSHQQFVFMIESRPKLFLLLMFKIAKTTFDPTSNFWISLLPTAITGQRTNTLQVITVSQLFEDKIRSGCRGFSDGKPRMPTVIKQCYGASDAAENLRQQRARKTRPQDNHINLMMLHHQLSIFA